MNTSTTSRGRTPKQQPTGTPAVVATQDQNTSREMKRTASERLDSRDEGPKYVYLNIEALFCMKLIECVLKMKI